MLYYDLTRDYINNNILIYFPEISLQNAYNHTLTPVFSVPLFTYGTIALTTIILATVTVFETGDDDESIFSKLPSFTTNEPPKTIFGGSSSNPVYSKTIKKRSIHKCNKTRYRKK